jgi:protein gp37
MADTKIEWTDRVWNPITGCTKVSEGCRNCYAERMAKRLRGRFGYPVDDPFAVTLHPERLEEPLHWRTPSRVFVCSMSDWMHPVVPTDFIDDMLEVVAACPQHTFITLTKRPENFDCKLYGVTEDNPCRELGGGDYFPNLWLGVSAEDQAAVDRRVETLIQTPAAVRLVSLEPLLGPVDLHLRDRVVRSCGAYSVTRTFLHWVIVGGESGPRARACDVEWIADVVRQCQAAGVPCFVKQLGARSRLAPPAQAAACARAAFTRKWDPVHVLPRSSKGPDISTWPAELRVRQWPEERGR